MGTYDARRGYGADFMVSEFRNHIKSENKGLVRPMSEREIETLTRKASSIYAQILVNDLYERESVWKSPVWCSFVAEVEADLNKRSKTLDQIRRERQESVQVRRYETLRRPRSSVPLNGARSLHPYNSRI